MSTEDSMSRRELLQILGAGMMIAVTGEVIAQERQGNNRRPASPLSARLHIGKDGQITVMTGKVECGQGARAQLTLAAAEELRVPPEHITLIMGDTELCPDDGPTAGSRTTPNTVPSVRQASAAARDILLSLAATRLSVPKQELTLADGAITHSSGRSVGYGDLVDDDLTKAFANPPGSNVQVTDVKEWKVLGASLPRPNGWDIVTGKHHYPSDIQREDMLYGAVLRGPTATSTIESIDLEGAKAIAGVTVVHDGDFVGVAAPKSFIARKAIAALAGTAKWKTLVQISTPQLFSHLEKTASRPTEPLGASATLKAEYHVAYVQHAPMEPRAAVAEWEGNKLTVWTGTQIPTRVRDQLQRTFSGAEVRVIVPDFGGGFGGKHTGECAVEAARLAKAAGKPVSLRWTRAEEFAFASYRPAALIQVDASLKDDGMLGGWTFFNINSGGAALQTPYRCAPKRELFIESIAPPLRHGSYRALASTANNFARESFIDELAHHAKIDPLTFRLKHLDNERMIAVLKSAAERFNFLARHADRNSKLGVGLACGTEKGSFVGTCVEVEINPEEKSIRVVSVVTAFECGKIQNPDGLLAQIEGAVIQGLGPALSEEILLDKGRVTNGSFAQYPVPRFNSVPKLDTIRLDRADLPSVGAGETPIIGIAPAIANAVFHATGQRIRTMPIRLA